MNRHKRHNRAGEESEGPTLWQSIGFGSTVKSCRDSVKARAGETWIRRRTLLGHPKKFIKGKGIR